ncbi:glycosyltransferase family 9 protein [Acidithiobacillus thiooxidans]|uniref:glycosyltransferase family 9 protein n=1 Tax=Acidithiobacillus TaxID=119977 RepID=UPI0018793371|nr:MULTISPECIES: glycosyltransferase family 9 protein [Acidithiobacillus]MBE7566150.1 glycosyltransferase family 9 protein [Acidithiobacillus sp. HP-11]MBU2749831.1 glycosyltransferase family 9 protein [Acidithiobacillus thiooxidans]
MARAIPANPRRILLIKSHSAGIGDILRSSAAWAVLKNRWPDVELHLLFLTRWPGYPSEALIREHFLLSSAHFLPMQEGHFWGMRGVGPRTWRRLLPELKKIAKQIQPDLIIDHEPHGLETTIAARWLRRFCKSAIVGVNQVMGRGLLYDRSGPSLQQYAKNEQLDWPMDYTERDFAALVALGLHRENQSIVLTETSDGRLFRDEMQQILPKDLPIIGLNIGCGTPDAEQKRPDLDLLVMAFGRAYKESPYILLLTGAPNESFINKSFIDKYKVKWGNNAHIIDIAGRTSSTSLTGAIKLCDAFVSSDSGPYHMAVALGVPTLALFNFSSPEHYHSKAEIFLLHQSCCSITDEISTELTKILLRKAS